MASTGAANPAESEINAYSRPRLRHTLCSKDSDVDAFDRFIEHLEEHAIASQSSLVGCSPDEVAALEQRYGVTLPATYRRYLELMGHKSGRLFTHDHMAVFYAYVLEMTADERDCALDEPDEVTIELPADALIVAGRLGEQFQFIRCNAPNDSPVWYYSEWDPDIKQIHDSVLDWLYCFAAEARDAIEGGYYRMFPNGTTP